MVESYTFIGWYDNGQLIASYSSYSLSLAITISCVNSTSNTDNASVEPENNWYNFGTGGPSYNTGPYSDPNWYYWWSSGGGGGVGGYSGYSSAVNYLMNNLGLNTSQSDWLAQNPDRANEIYNYLQTTSQPNANQISIEHLNRLISDADYLSFVQNHYITSTSSLMWWEDDIWLSNPNNFNLDLDLNQNNQYDELTAAEKALLKIYPDQAYRMSKNVQKANDESDALFPLLGGLNDKKDAFRHAYFNAINSRDIIGTLLKTRAEIVREFGIAHESEVPPQLNLEKQMDLHNNDEGISVCGGCFFASDNDISNGVIDKLNNGSLRYLAPLDFVNYPRYDKNNPSCSNCTDGIIPGQTILKPTNQ